MIYAELPKSNPGISRIIQKKHTSIIAPDKIVLNEKLLLSLMVTGVATVLITWAFRKSRKT